MTFEEWQEQYQPVANILNQDASFDGLMFETYGAELGMIKAVNDARPTSVWTVVEGDNGHRFLSAGYHFVNRSGYFLTVNPWANGFTDIDLDKESLMIIEQNLQLETLYDLTVNLTADLTSGVIPENKMPDSRERFSQLIDWANEFNKLHEGREWDGDYFDVLDDFYAAKTADIRQPFNQRVQFTRATSAEISKAIGGV